MKQKSVFLVLFLIGIFFVFSHVAYTAAAATTQFISTAVGHSSTSQAGVQAFSAEKSFPFPKTATQKTGGSGKKRTMLQRGTDLMTTFKQFVEDNTTEKFKHRFTFILSLKRFEKLAGMNMTTSLNGITNDVEKPRDVVVQFSDGMLGYVIDEYAVDHLLEDNIQSVISFGKQMEDQGRQFLFFHLPYKSGQIDESYLGVFQDDCTAAREKINSAFSASGLHYYSFDQYIDTHGLDRSTLFFKTDHHWTPQTAMLANQIISEELNRDFGYQIDPGLFDLDRYDVEYGSRPMFGSMGRKVTTVYADPEPLPILLPKAETNFEVFNSYNNSTTTGSLKDTLMNYDVFGKKYKSIHENSTYSVFGYGDQAYIRIHNLDRNDGKKILMIKVSHANLMFPYLSQAVEYIDVVDLRKFNGSLQTLIEKNDPDTVIVLYGVQTLLAHYTNQRSSPLCFE